MKSFMILCLFTFFSLSVADTKKHYRGCFYILGRCIEECPVGTHAYVADCSRKTPEPTCDQPKPVPEEGKICDYSACYCNAPTVRDTTTKKCVPLEKCPKKHHDKQA